MSNTALNLMYWVNNWRLTTVADYDNSYEFDRARSWAALIIGGNYQAWN